MHLLELELPYPPTINNYWRSYRGRVVISEDGRKFRQLVCMILARKKVQPLLGPFDISIKTFPPDSRRRDIDNVLKALLDALQHGGAYHDDYQIARLSIERQKTVPGGKTLIQLQQADQLC